jgi:tetratricopeptide (TPR) repeat protein
VGTALTELGRYDEAKRVLEYGLRKFPKSCALWTGLGILCDILGLYFDALKCFDTALRFNYGENSGPLYNKALILIRLGSYGDAASIIECLIEEYPEEPRYLAEKGFCCLEMGYPQEALHVFQRAMELYERFPTVDAGVSIYSGLCCAYMDLGMKKEAMEVALEGLKTFPDEDPTLYHNVGATFYEMGWKQEATEILKKGVEKFPDDAELKAFLKDVEDDLNDPDGDIKPRFLGLLLLALLHKRLKKKS